MKVDLTDARRARLVTSLQTMFSKEFDEPLSDFRAEQIIDMMLRTLGPAIYNQAVQDVRAHFQAKVDDLEGEIFADGDL
jgi:uncharacterized protein (DUF2164 family)